MLQETLVKKNKISQQISDLENTLKDFNSLLKNGKANFTTIHFTVCEDEYEDIYQSCFIESFRTNSLVKKLIEKQFFDMKETIENEILRLKAEFKKI